MIQSKKKTQDLLLSFIKSCETLIEQTHTKPQETSEFKLTKSRQSFSFKPSNNLGLDSKVMIGLTILEVINSIFNVTEEKNKFDFYTHASDDEFSYTQLKNKSLVFQIFYPKICNTKYMDQVLIKHNEN